MKFKAELFSSFHFILSQAPRGQLRPTETRGPFTSRVRRCAAIVRGNHAEVKEGQEK